MTSTEVLPDVDVDESELTQQPCTRKTWRLYKHVPCGAPAVGENISVCACGHVRQGPSCADHLGLPPDPAGLRVCCQACYPEHRCVLTLIVSRYYRSAS